MAEELQKVHLYYDDINKIRVLETSVQKETEDLKDTSKDYEANYAKQGNTGSSSSSLARAIPLLNMTLLKKEDYGYKEGFVTVSIFDRRLKNWSKMKMLLTPQLLLVVIFFDLCDEQNLSIGFWEIQDFGKIINSLLEVLKELGDNLEKKKMAAIGSTNLLKSIEKERESEQDKLQAEINDKTIILEQLDNEYDALQILEATQIETIEYLTQLR